MILWLRSLFAWRDVRDTGVWLYQENSITKARRAVRSGTGHQPQDWRWITAPLAKDE